MPNRIIKESICTSENLDNLSKDAEIFFYRLIVSCDDYGLMDARIPILRAKCFPLKLKSIEDIDIEKWLAELQNAKLIFLYNVDGKNYLKMTSWEKHQQIRSKKPKFPIPDINCNQLISNDINCDRNPIQSNPNPIQSESNLYVCDPSAEKPKKGRAQETGKGDYSDIFIRFWDAYPRQIEKLKAFRAWNKQLKEKINPEDMIKAAINYSLHCENQHTEEQFIKHPSTFLGPDKPYKEYVNIAITKPQQRKNPAANYSGQRQYDINKLEAALLGRDTDDNSE